MSLKDVHTALRAAVVSALGSISTAYENVPFVPTANTKWAQVFFLPNDPSVSTLGAGGTDAVDGIVQITVNYPEGTGDDGPDNDTETMRGLFYAGRYLTSGSQTVKIVACGRGEGQLKDGWFSVPITITWQAWITR